MDTNKRIFKLIKQVSSSFYLTATGFSVVTTLLFRIRDKIKLTFIMSLITKFTQQIRIKRVKLSFIIKLIEKPSILIRTKIRLVSIMKEILKFTIPIFIRARVVWNMRLIQKFPPATISLKKIKITFTPQIFEFLKLSTFDPQTLATLDTKALGEMDYNGWTP